ncbi:hypothetical protein Hanom_Chr11g01033071 [Helianthus anomalus]
MIILHGHPNLKIKSRNIVFNFKKEKYNLSFSYFTKGFSSRLVPSRFPASDGCGCFSIIVAVSAFR